MTILVLLQYKCIYIISFGINLSVLEINIWNLFFTGNMTVDIRWKWRHCCIVSLKRVPISAYLTCFWPNCNIKCDYPWLRIEREREHYMPWVYFNIQSTCIWSLGYTPKFYSNRELSSTVPTFWHAINSKNNGVGQLKK